MSNETQEDRLLKLEQVRELVGISRSQIYALISEGLFPSPISLSNLGRSGPGSRCSRWSYQQIQKWIRDKLESASDNNFPK